MSLLGLFSVSCGHPFPTKDFQLSVETDPKYTETFYSQFPMHGSDQGIGGKKSKRKIQSVTNIYANLLLALK